MCVKFIYEFRDLQLKTTPNDRFSRNLFRLSIEYNFNDYLVHECQEFLLKISNHSKVTLTWVRRHINIIMHCWWTFQYQIWHGFVTRRRLNLIFSARFIERLNLIGWRKVHAILLHYWSPIRQEREWNTALMYGPLPQSLFVVTSPRYSRGRICTLMTLRYLTLLIHWRIVAKWVIFHCPIATTKDFTRTK